MTTAIVDHQLPDDTHNLYDVTFEVTTISTIVTKTPSYVDSWIAETERIHRNRLHRLNVGLDVKSRPNRSRNSDYPVATLQLCVKDRCLVFQILHSPTVPESLKNFLRNPSYTFAGVGIEKDVEKLRKDYNLVVANTGDVRWLADAKYGLWGELHNAPLKELTLLVLGDELKRRKGVRVGRWDNQRLTSTQVEYALRRCFLEF